MALVKTWSYDTWERNDDADGDHTITKIGWKYEGTDGVTEGGDPVVVFSITGTHKLQVPDSDLAVAMGMPHIPFDQVDEDVVKAWLDADSNFVRAEHEARAVALNSTVSENSPW